MNTTLLRQSVSELLGTFAIVLAIGGTTMIAFANGGRVMDIALGSGFAVMLLTSIFMAQGAHFNPAITIAMLFTRRIGALPAGVRIAAQVIGATLAAVLVTTLYPSEVVTATRAGGTIINVAVTGVHAFVLELVAGFVLMLAYSASLIDKQGAKLAGVPVRNLISRTRHVGSATIHSGYAEANSRTFPRNGAYYAAKWGGLPGHETVTTAPVEPVLDRRRLVDNAWT